MNNLIYTLSIVLLLSTITFPQRKTTHPTIDSLQQKRVDLGYRDFPVVFCDTATRFPDTIHIKGVIDGITSVPALCGVMCWWGSAVLHLEERPIGYFRDTVYLAVMCLFGDDSNFVGKSIETSVSKLFRKNISHSCEIMVNRFDSHGQPFYKLTDENKLVLGKLR